MIADLINPLVTASIAVLKQVMPNKNIQKQELSIKKELTLSHNSNNTIIEVSGEINGFILFDMNEETAIRLAEFMNNAKFDSYTPMVKATINELANMIAGKMISHLREYGKDLQISTPFQKTKEELTSRSISKIMIVPIQIDTDNLNIIVAV